MTKYLLGVCALFLSVPVFSQQSNVSKPYHKIVRKVERDLHRIEKKQLKYQKSEERELENEDFHQNRNKFSQENSTPDGYWKQEWISTMNPVLGRPTPEVLLDEINAQQAKSLNRRSMPGTTKTSWVTRGPNNVGGRCRTIAYDPTVSTGKKVWAGAVTGGLWYNNDITSASSAWQFVSGLWSNLAVTCIAFDPNAPGTMYVGTGEGWGSTPSTSRGLGIFKSVDSGKTFTQLNATKSFFYINDIVVRNEAGKSVIYCATDLQYFAGAWHGTSAVGLMRSTNDGVSFSNVMPTIPSSSNVFVVADLELAADNRIWVGTRQNYFQSGADKGGGRIMYSDNGTTWTVAYSHTNQAGRVEVACAPSSAYTLYAVFEAAGKVDTLIRSHNKGKTWSTVSKPKDADAGIPATDPSRGQAWYDLTLAVSPVDTTVVMAGFVDVFQTQNRGVAWQHVGKWSNNSGLANLSCSYVHADIHVFTFKPGTTECLIGTDGGIFYAPDIMDNMSNQAVIYEANNGFTVTQMYWGDISQTKGKDLMLGGAQDNGTHQLNTSGLCNENMVGGGDGGYCFISQTNDNKQIVSYVYNQFYSTTNNWTANTKILDDPNTGKFINPAVWDDLNGYLFAGKSKVSIYRNKLGTSATLATTVTVNGTAANGAPSAFCSSVSAAGKTQLYVGTDVGKLYVTTDAILSTPTWKDISGSTGSAIPAGNISSIHRLRLSDTLFVTISNYGATANILMSVDAGATWTSKDGNIADMPIWSILINPNKLGEAVIATELGIYGTSDIFATSVVWTPYNEGMGAVKTATLRYRSSDQTILAVTHGRGIFTSDAWSKASPIANFGISKDTVCSNQTVTLKDSTRNVPTSWKWSFNPKTGVVYKFGTDSTKQNPIVQFTKGGTYSITLSVSNSLGDDVMVKMNRIVVIDTIPLIVNLVTNPAILCRNDTFSLRSTVNAAAKGLVLSYSWTKNSVVTSATKQNIYGISPNNGDAFRVTVNTKSACVIPNPSMSSVVTIKTYGVKSITVSCNLDTLKAANVGTGTYTWYKDGISVGTGRLLKATKVGNYRCVYTENGCNSDSSAILMLKSVGTGKIDMNQFLVIYPNPAKDVLNVSVTEPGKLKLMDVAGRLIREWNISGKGLHTLSLEGIPAGNAIVGFETVSQLKYNTLSIVIQ